MSSTLERATEALQAQAAKGMEKYLVPLESAGHSLSALLVHKQQEVADELMYTTEAIERARELEAEREALIRVTRKLLRGHISEYVGNTCDVCGAYVIWVSPTLNGFGRWWCLNDCHKEQIALSEQIITELKAEEAIK